MSFLILIFANILFIPIGLGYLIYFFCTPRRGLLANLKNELRERFCFYPPQYAKSHDALWIHCASVGEVRAVEFLCREIKKIKPSIKIIITSSTAAGKKTALELDMADQCLLAPLDFYPISRRFVKIFRPSCLLVMETELWPNMFYACKNNGVKIALVNARVSAKTAKVYKLISPLIKKMLSFAVLACAQTEEVKRRLISLGMDSDKIDVSGNIKYDALLNPVKGTKEARETITALNWNNCPILTCASTHPAEEEILLPVFVRAREKFPNLKMILAPRHIERLPAVRALLERAQISAGYISNRAFPAPADVLVLDVMGLLAGYFPFSSVIFVGGSLIDKGGHNALEAAICGKPILIGGYTRNIKTEASALIKNGGGFEISAKNFDGVLTQLLSDDSARGLSGQNARETALSFTGATQKILRKIEDNFLAQ